MSIGRTVQNVYDSITEPVLLTLSKAWIGIGIVRPAKTDDSSMFKIPDWLKNKKGSFERVEGSTPTIDRFDYSKLFSLQIGDFFMPLSQTFTLQASKRINVSSLVDGVDIIQQTRKEAKTIDCSLRISMRESNTNMSIVDASNSVIELATFLQTFYEKDAILAIENDMINNVFGVTYVFISKYKFQPKVGSQSFLLDFSLTEVAFGENVLTFNVREVSADKRQISG